MVTDTSSGDNKFLEWRPYGTSMLAYFGKKAGWAETCMTQRNAETYAKDGPPPWLQNIVTKSDCQDALDAPDAPHR